MTVTLLAVLAVVCTLLLWLRPRPKNVCVVQLHDVPEGWHVAGVVLAQNEGDRERYINVEDPVLAAERVTRQALS